MVVAGVACALARIRFHRRECLGEPDAVVVLDPINRSRRSLSAVRHRFADGEKSILATFGIGQYAMGMFRCMFGHCRTLPLSSRRPAIPFRMPGTTFILVSAGSQDQRNVGFPRFCASETQCFGSVATRMSGTDRFRTAGYLKNI